MALRVVRTMMLMLWLGLSPSFGQDQDKTLAAYKTVLTRTETLWNQLITQEVIKKRTDPDQELNIVTLTFIWRRQPRFPRVFIISKHALESSQLKADLYFIRVSDTTGWTIMKSRNWVGVYRLAVNKDGNGLTDFSQEATADELKEFITYFTPDSDSTNVIINEAGRVKPTITVPPTLRIPATT